MFEWLEEEQRYEFMHHPFTSPLESDASLLESDPGSVRARAYDLVLNGSEMAGGSIRIHDQQLQRLIFKLLQISDEEAKMRFGFFLDALEYGTPPHGGIAIGLDRTVADPVRRAVHPRRHRVPEDRAGGRPDGGRAVDGEPQAAERAALEDGLRCTLPGRSGQPPASAFLSEITECRKRRKREAGRANDQQEAGRRL